MIYCHRFGYKTSVKALEDHPDIDEQKEYENILVGFIQVEAEDETNFSNAATKSVKNLKWAARKNETERIMLHSFAHLSDSKASPEITAQFFENAFQRLTDANYETFETPFGYYLDLDIDAPGNPLTRLFKSF